MLAVVGIPSRDARPSGSDEDTLSQELRTAGLLRPHVLVGYQWSHTRFCPGDQTSHNRYIRSFVSQPPPNRTCAFRRIRLSSSRKSGTVGLTVKSEAYHFPWRSLVPVNLPPFASWTALPSSDYYGGSVALRLAPVRRSRLSCSSDVQDGCRCPVRVLQ